jgi:hypothetical protein
MGIAKVHMGFGLLCRLGKARRGQAKGGGKDQCFHELLLSFVL